MPSPIYQYVIYVVVSLPIRRGVQVYLGMFQCGIIVLLTTTFFDVVKFTILTPVL